MGEHPLQGFLLLSSDESGIRASQGAGFDISICYHMLGVSSACSSADCEVGVQLLATPAAPGFGSEDPAYFPNMVLKQWVMEKARQTHPEWASNLCFSRLILGEMGDRVCPIYEGINWVLGSFVAMHLVDGSGRH